MSAADKSLLIELGTEELPPKALDELAAAFLRGMCDGLATRGIEAALDQARAYCTPRRLAVHSILCFRISLRLARRRRLFDGR